SRGLGDVYKRQVHDSVLGLDKSEVIARFLTQITGKFSVAEGSVLLQGVVIDIDPQTGRAVNIERVNADEEHL
ncbi:MAG: YmdB family metallophosphoesterase, partial [Armatimonadetes bacterium]|nr:YmdB family metallophosphoesterase [Armatimonadota bacterium]